MNIKEIEENIPDGIGGFVKSMGLNPPKGKRLICTVYEFYWRSYSFDNLEPKNSSFYIDVATGKAYGWNRAAGLIVSPGVSNNVLDNFVKVSKLIDLSKSLIALLIRDEPSVINGFKAISKDGTLPNQIWLKDYSYENSNLPLETWIPEKEFLKALKKEKEEDDDY